jgi:HprK-related kinase A
VKLGELPLDWFGRELEGPGVTLDVGAAIISVRSDLPELASVLQIVYGELPYQADPGFCDVRVRLRRRRGLRGRFRPQVDLLVDGKYPFDPFPADTPLPLLEWGANWCIGSRCNQHLLLHAGVVERDGRAVLLPALPGSGKSTLTAALTTRGYRLLSDEFGVVRLNDGHLLPMLRPIALKNDSIDVIRAYAPNAVLGPVYPKTRKGSVAHLAPDAVSVLRRKEAARPVLILFPRFERGSPVMLERMPESRAFSRVSVNSFNYGLLGPDAFEAVGRLIDTCDAYRFQYGDLNEAIEVIDDLVAGGAADHEPLTSLVGVA